MSIIKYSPLWKIWDHSHSWDDFFGGDSFASAFATPRVDMIETPEAVKVEVECAGMTPEDISITVEGRVLVISGEKHTQAPEADSKYLMTERTYGKFTRKLLIPDGLNTESAAASAEKGVITVTIPKVEVEEPKKLRIKVSSPTETKVSE